MRCRLSARMYNIVQHVLPEHWAPKYIPSERQDRRLAHPSQQSLERGRNMQGFMPPSLRCTSPTLNPQL
jgi:hypothetical protein